MPIYEYKCEDCGAETEFMQKAGDAHKKKCPKCGGKLKKRFSAPAIKFKGSGWYITDNAKKSTAKARPCPFLGRLCRQGHLWVRLLRLPQKPGLLELRPIGEAFFGSSFCVMKQLPS